MPPTFASGGDDPVSGDPTAPTACPGCGGTRHAGRHGWTCARCALKLALDAGRGGAGADGSLGGASSGRFFDHYEMVRDAGGQPCEVGRGAMGVTYKGWDLNRHCPVALKVIHRELLHEPAVRERFVREARAAAGLKHPNVAAVHHLGTRGEEWFFAMEFIEGETLEALVRRRGPLGCGAALEIGVQVARALGAAERMGLVHRDIKPSNLMLVHEPGTDRDAGPWLVKVIDFGVARSAAVAAAGGADLTGGLLVGTPSFASPEQLRGDPTDFRSDAYSLGVTLWWTLLGRTPFAGDSFQVVGQHLSKRPPFQELGAAGVPAPVVALLRALLGKAPADRPQTAAALLEHLAGAVAALPSPEAPTAGRGTRLTLPGRRMPPALLSGGAAATRWRTRARRRLRRWVPLVLGAALAVTGILVAILRRESSRPPAILLPPVSASVSAPAAKESAAGTVRSLAVLPFSRREGGGEMEALLADGLAEDATARLSKLDGLKVISQASCGTFRGRDVPPAEIAARLGVRGLLLGRVHQGADGQLTIHVELVDGPDGGRVLWSETYDHIRPDDLALVQGRLSGDVAANLRLMTSPDKKVALTRPLTENALAYDRYLRGRIFYNRSTAADLARAGELFRQAIELDPQFALAHAALASTYGQQAGYDRGPAQREPAQREPALAAAREAIRLDPNAPEGHCAMALLRYHQGRFSECLQSCQRALQVDPNHPRATSLAAAAWRNMGRLDQAVHLLHRAVASDPLNVRIQVMLAETLTLLDDDAGAAIACDRALTLQPDHQEAFYARAYLHLLQGDAPKARSELAAARAFADPTSRGKSYAATIEFFDGQTARAEPMLRDLLRDNPDAGAGCYQAMSSRSALACLRLRAGDGEEARRLLEEAAGDDETKMRQIPDSARPIYDLAAVRTLQGRNEEALVLLQRATATGWSHHRATWRDPRFAALAEDERFKSLLGQWRGAVAQMGRAEMSGPP